MPGGLNWLLCDRSIEEVSADKQGKGTDLQDQSCSVLYETSLAPVCSPQERVLDDVANLQHHGSTAHTSNTLSQWILRSPAVFCIIFMLLNFFIRNCLLHHQHIVI